MRILSRYLTTAALACALLPGDWPTSGGDPQRSGWARSETTITRDNVNTLQVEWKIKLDNEPRELNSLMTPVAIDKIITPRGFKEFVFVAGSSDNLYVLDADTGK